MSASPRPADAELTALVCAAQSGDDVAWSRLVDRFDRMLRSVARRYRLSPQDVDDVVQATWVKLYEHIDRLRDSSAIAGWLATTVRRESLRLLQVRVREQLIDVPDRRGDGYDGPESRLLEIERGEVLSRALATLPDHQRQLMTLIASDADTNYKQISGRLNIAVGSIGPTRARSLARLRHHEELRELAHAG